MLRESKNAMCSYYSINTGLRRNPKKMVGALGRHEFMLWLKPNKVLFVNGQCRLDYENRVKLINDDA